jgi:hypothetical protein
MARTSRHLRRDSDVTHVATHDTVELRGFEPLTFCMPCSVVSSDSVALCPITALQSKVDVCGRLAQSGGIWGRWYLVWSWFAGPPGRSAAPRRVTVLRCAGPSKAHRSSDIRVIISAYPTEKISDDHPYIWRYKARRAW